ncbi:MAG: signal peptidase I [Clostridiales bacterium]|nr:signal peptidase I [Clostridiales bacterium]
MNEKSYKKSKVDLATSIFGWISFALALIMVAATFISFFSDSKNGKEFLGAKIFIVQTDSMSKGEAEDEGIFFNAGDVVLIKTVQDNTKFKEGDVIAFISLNAESYGKTLTHKIREVKYNTVGELIGYVTYGINTDTNDQTLVQPENVIGEYAGKVPAVGHVFAFLKTERGYATCILLPLMLLAIHFSIKLGGLLERKRLKKLGFDIDGVLSAAEEVKEVKEIASTAPKNEEKPLEQVKGQLVPKTSKEKKVNKTEEAEETEDQIVQQILAKQKELKLSRKKKKGKR